MRVSGSEQPWWSLRNKLLTLIYCRTWRRRSEVTVWRIISPRRCTSRNREVKWWMWWSPRLSVHHRVSLGCASCPLWFSILLAGHWVVNLCGTDTESMVSAIYMAIYVNIQKLFYFPDSQPSPVCHIPHALLGTSRPLFEKYCFSWTNVAEKKSTFATSSHSC